MAERCFRAWINEIDGDEGNGCRWVRINEFGAFPNKPLFHILLGRTRVYSKYSLMCLWQEIAGDADLEYFWLHGNTFTFIADIALFGSEFEVAHDLQ